MVQRENEGRFLAEGKKIPPHYRALEGADEALQNGGIDLTQMEELLSDMLAKQLVAVHEDARSEHL